MQSWHWVPPHLAVAWLGGLGKGPAVYFTSAEGLRLDRAQLLSCWTALDSLCDETPLCLCDEGHRERGQLLPRYEPLHLPQDPFLHVKLCRMTGFLSVCYFSLLRRVKKRKKQPFPQTACLRTCLYPTCSCLSAEHSILITQAAAAAAPVSCRCPQLWKTGLWRLTTILCLQWTVVELKGIDFR